MGNVCFQKKVNKTSDEKIDYGLTTAELKCLGVDQDDVKSFYKECCG